jgi:hypothetical protein
VSPETEAFLARITGAPSRLDTAAFVAAITGRDDPADASAPGPTSFDEHHFNPNEPRDERGRWTTRGSDSDRLGGTTGGAPTASGNSPTCAQSVADEKKSGLFDKKRDKSPTAPLSIDMTKKGDSPFIHQSTRKPNQPPDGININPWLGRGGEKVNVGDVIHQGLDGNLISLEWVITFRGNPYNASWGRSSYRWDQFSLDRNGRIRKPLAVSSADDTDPENDYISGNKLYMYDQPGSRLGNSPACLFEVWAKSGNLADPEMITNWYYVDPNKGEFYQIDRPWDLPPPRLQSCPANK